jgi:hypothetical protein
MTLFYKITMLAALAGALTVILRKASVYERSSRAARIPTLQPVEDARPNQAEPLQAEDLRVAQNSPL